MIEITDNTIAIILVMFYKKLDRCLDALTTADANNVFTAMKSFKNTYNSALEFHNNIHRNTLSEVYKSEWFQLKDELFKLKKKVELLDE